MNESALARVRSTVQVRVLGDTPHGRKPSFGDGTELPRSRTLAAAVQVACHSTRESRGLVFDFLDFAAQSNEVT